MTSRQGLRDRLSVIGPLTPDIARGVRASLATLVPFFLARRFGHQELVWMALGGWFGTLADPGGSRMARAKILAAFGAFGAALIAASRFALSSAVLGTAFLALVAFIGSLLRAVGAAASAVGTFLVIVAAIACGGTLGDPLRDAVAFAVGAAWAIVLSSIVWPVWTHLELRIALAAAFRATADYARALGDLVARSTPEHDPAWATL
ncbi:MAG TPA: FUSC family membrane protein, partial [Labilithrix sp.]|nr:FUSC family membrane protein [Labilithrix sp.]